MLDVALLVGGALLILSIVPLARSLARRAARARLRTSTRGEQPPQAGPDLVADLTDVVAHAAGFRFRLIDTAGSELGIVTHAAPDLTKGASMHLADGRRVTVLEVYGDEYGQEGNVRATLVVRT